jgi:ubiquitin-protein ligase
MSKTVKISKDKRTKSLVGHLKRCTVKDVHPHIKFIPAEDRLDKWYFMIGIQVGTESDGEFFGGNDEFKGAQFLGEIVATSKYPYEPPNAKLYTPTGIYPADSADFCVDIGKYHKNNWPPSYGMDGFVKMLLSGLIGWKDLGFGINLFNGERCAKRRIEIIKKASHDSREYNQKKNSHILKLFINTDQPNEKNELSITNKLKDTTI